MQVGRERVTAETTKRSAALEERLRNGFERIGQAMQQGVAVDNWERHFANLLKEYEGLEDILREERERAQLEQTAMELGVREVRDVA